METTAQDPNPHETVTVPKFDFETLLVVATIYIKSFADDETMTLLERMRLQDVEDIIGRYGERY